MRRTIRVCSLFLLYPALSLEASGSENMPGDSSSFTFYFRDQAKILERLYRGNGAEVDRMDDVLRHHRRDLRSGKSHLAVISYIMPGDIHSPKTINSASVHGSIVRAHVLKFHLVDHRHFTFLFDTAACKTEEVRITYMPTPIPEGLNQTICYTLSDRADSVSWAAGLYKPLPIATSGFLSTNNKGAAESVNETTTVLQESSSAVLLKDEPVAGPPVAEHPEEPEPAPPQAVGGEKQPVKDPDLSVPGDKPGRLSYPARKKTQTTPFLAIRTNLLYLGGITPEPDWTGAIPNAEIAWYFGKRWSLNAGVSYAYFEKSNADHEIRGLSSLSLEPRIWLSGPNLYKGLYAGLYALTGDFDVKLNELSSDGQTGTFQEGGLSLGYYLPFSRRWGMEAGVRAGYRTVDCDRYRYQDPRYYYQSAYTQDGIKLTGFSLLIVYRMGKSCKQIK